MRGIEEKVKLIHQRLGIPEDYGAQFGLVLQREATHFTQIENDIYNRRQLLECSAATAWKKMRRQAVKDDIIFQVVSAFRSIDRQAEIIQRKIDSGQVISDILRVSAAPGYSEHHTGRAIDLTIDGCATLTEVFEETLAFKWLQEYAHLFSFCLSYPKDNKYGIAYEPWHWAYTEY